METSSQNWNAIKWGDKAHGYLDVTQVISFKMRAFVGYGWVRDTAALWTAQLISRLHYKTKLPNNHALRNECVGYCGQYCGSFPALHQCPQMVRKNVHTHGTTSQPSQRAERKLQSPDPGCNSILHWIRHALGSTAYSCSCYESRHCCRHMFSCPLNGNNDVSP